MTGLSDDRIIGAPEFAGWLEALTTEAQTAEPLRFAVAVSGGADSIALTLLAHDFARARGGSIAALTVDHGLRPESGTEAVQVGAYMAARGIAHYILKPERPITGSLQAAARAMRYRLLGEYCGAHGIRRLLLAHHRDDQAETVVLRIRRGSHVDGLAAMRPALELHGVILLRPLLACPKSRLRATLEAASQPWIEDPTNALPYYDRNRLRAILAALPNAEEVSGKLAQAAAQLGRLRERNETKTAAWLGEYARFNPDGAATVDANALMQLPPDNAFRALSALLCRIGQNAYPPRFPDLERLYAALADPNCRRGLHRCRLERRGDSLHISLEILVKSG